MKNVTLSTTATKVAQAGKHPLVFQNQGTVSIKLQYDGGDGSTLVTSTGFEVKPNQWFSPARDLFPYDVYAVAVSGTPTIHVQGEN